MFDIQTDHSIQARNEKNVVVNNETKPYQIFIPEKKKIGKMEEIGKLVKCQDISREQKNWVDQIMAILKLLM